MADGAAGDRAARSAPIARETWPEKVAVIAEHLYHAADHTASEGKRSQ